MTTTSFHNFRRKNTFPPITLPPRRRFFNPSKKVFPFLEKAPKFFFEKKKKKAPLQAVFNLQGRFFFGFRMPVLSVLSGRKCQTAQSR